MRERFYSARLAKDGPLVGVRLFLGAPVIDGEEQDRSPRLNVLVDTEPTSRYVWQLAENGCPVDVEGCTMRIIGEVDEAEYQYLLARGHWAQEHSPYHIAAAPRQTVDVRAIKGIF